MKKYVSTVALGLALLLASAHGWAEESTPTISADRPGFSTGSSTVPTQRFQLEAGLGFEYVEGFAQGDVSIADQNIVSAPNLLARYGLADFAEVRLQVPNISYDMAAPVSQAEAAFGAVSLGAKVGTQVADSLSVALVGNFALGVESGRIAGDLIGIAGFSVTDWLSVTANGLATIADSGATSFAASLSPGFSITDEVGAYVEWYATGLGDGTAHFGEVGATYLLSRTFQLDGFVGAQLPDTDSIYVGLGASTLF